LTSCYYDSTTAASLTPVGSSLGTATGAVAGLSRDEMTADDTLLVGMAGLAASGHWMKRANIAAELYYPELSTFGTAGGTIQTASKSSVTVPLTLFTVMVEQGSGSGDYESGTVIDITADAAPSGKVFDKWTSSGGGSF
ncbi:MAG: hypothetical protein AAGU77_11845, partial [Bacillota bacterium]